MSSELHHVGFGSSFSEDWRHLAQTYLSLINAAA